MLAMEANDNAGYLTPRGVVGASLLAMEVNDNAGYLIPRGVLRFFASRLAPTGHPAMPHENKPSMPGRRG